MRLVTNPLNKLIADKNTRRRQVTDEPMFIKPELLGLPLAVAMLMDLVCAMIFIVLIMVLIVIIRAPKYIPLHSKMDHAVIGTAAYES